MSFLENMWGLALYIVSEWSVFQAFLVFPLLLLAVKLWTKLRAGGSIAASDFSVRSEMVWSVSNNLALALVNSLLWVGLLAGAYSLIDAFWTQMIGTSRFAMIQDIPLWGQFLVCLILLDFTNYWSHRILHHPWLWDIHSLHHSDEHMNHTTSVRIHILESLQMSLVSMMILGWLNLPIETVLAAGLIRKWYGFYIHSGLPFDHGPLRKVLASPNYHRWHHADEPSIYGKNLCDMFPVWDILFGTHHDPGRCDLPTGVSDAPDNVVLGQLHPFRLYWKRLRALVQRDRVIVQDPTQPPLDRPAQL